MEVDGEMITESQPRYDNLTLYPAEMESRGQENDCKIDTKHAELEQRGTNVQKQKFGDQSA